MIWQPVARKFLLFIKIILGGNALVVFVDMFRSAQLDAAASGMALTSC